MYMCRQEKIDMYNLTCTSSQASNLCLKFLKKKFIANVHETFNFFYRTSDRPGGLCWWNPLFYENIRKENNSSSKIYIVPVYRYTDIQIYRHTDIRSFLQLLHVLPPAIVASSGQCQVL